MITLEEFENRLRSAARADVEQMVANAKRNTDPAYAKLASEVFQERFGSVARRSGGSTPTTAIFRGKQADFPSGKDAYIWMIERFRQYHPGLLENQDHWHDKAFKGTTRRFFAKEAASLFPAGSELSSSSSNFSKLSEGWYANINLKHEQKFQILIRLSVICRLSYPSDWDFIITGATPELAQIQKTTVFAAELLRELDNM